MSLLLSHPQNRNAARIKSRRGFTLVELIMTIVVVAIVSVPLSLLIGQHFESVLQSKDYTVAMNLARLEIEIVNNLSFGNINPANYSSYQGYPYDVIRDVLVVSPPGPEGLKQITITVRRAGGSKDLAKFITYIANNVTYGL